MISRMGWDVLRPVMGLPVCVIDLAYAQLVGRTLTMHDTLIPRGIIMHPLENRLGILRSP